MSKSLNDIYDKLINALYLKYKHIIKRVTSQYRGNRIIKVRIIFLDNSFLDIFWSSSGKYSLHWERRHIDNTLYRYDNAPHWKDIPTFPKHFHNGSEDNVTISNLPDNPFEAIMQFLDFIAHMLMKK
ncbi:MAG: hypothetical protein DRO67_06025 [Candidatus Asgardarchaeum californiense]|nr:MAG: hypothetical protein DRO67_06025 [Candidatus Asgardarchaeum californiense]